MVKTPTSTFSHTNDDCDHISSGFEKKRVEKGLFFIVKIPLSNQHDLLLNALAHYFKVIGSGQNLL